MANQTLGLGSAANDGTGDTLRAALDKVNDNFSEIYTLIGSGTALTSGLSATASVVTLSSAVGTFTTLTPAASDGTALGSASLEFSDLFLADAAVINLGADQDTTLTHVADTGILLNSTRQLQFGDSGTYIHQSADGVLDLVADTEIEINATTIDINGAVVASGEIAAVSLDISGDVDVDGTLEADAITIDGVTLSETISDTVGAMVGSNTETGISVTYEDGDNTLDFVLGSSQTTISSLTNASLVVGRDADNDIDFATDNNIIFRAAGTDQIKLVDGALAPVTDAGVDLGTSTLEFKDAFFDGTVTSDAFAGPLTGEVTGNAATATTLATARTIGGTSFDGSANIAVALASVGTAVTVADESSDTTCFPLFATAATGDLPPKSGSNLTFNASSGLLTATLFAGALTGNVTGNASGTAATVTGAAQSAITSVGTLTTLQVDNININGNAITSTAGTDLTISPVGGQQIVLDGAIVIDAGVVTGATSITSTAFVGGLTGNASTATALATARTIGGTSFDGSGNIAVALASVGTAVTVADESSDTTCFPLFTTAATGDLPPKSGTNLTFNSSTGIVTATGFAGALTGNVTGNASGTAATVTGAAQTAITSVGTLTALQVDNLNINGNTLSSTAGTDLLITPLGGQQIVLDGAIIIDAGVVTGATSITSSSFVGALTGNASGTAATVTGAAQTNITSVGTLTALQIDNLNINGNTLSSTAGTDLLITPLSGQQIVLDGAIIIDAGVVTGATSITSTAFVGNVTGNLAGTVSTATQNSITTATGLVSVGALNSGSITSGFTSIDVGAGAISTTGAVTYGSLNDGTTALGATAAELNILDASAGNVAAASDVATSAGAVTSNNAKISHTITLNANLADDAIHADIVVTSDKCLATSVVMASSSLAVGINIHTIAAGSFKVSITNLTGAQMDDDSTLVVNYRII
jgi:hypothetical protein